MLVKSLSKEATLQDYNVNSQIKLDKNELTGENSQSSFC